VTCCPLLLTLQARGNSCETTHHTPASSPLSAPPPPAAAAACRCCVWRGRGSLTPDTWPCGSTRGADVQSTRAGHLGRAVCAACAVLCCAEAGGRAGKLTCDCWTPGCSAAHMGTCGSSATCTFRHLLLLWLHATGVCLCVRGSSGAEQCVKLGLIARDGRTSLGASLAGAADSFSQLCSPPTRASKFWIVRQHLQMTFAASCRA
jgi:hypothetical protein